MAINNHRQPRVNTFYIICKLFSILLLVAPIVTALDVTSEVNTITYDGEDYITIDFSLDNYTDLYLYQIGLHYDTEVLELQTVFNGDIADFTISTFEDDYADYGNFILSGVMMGTDSITGTNGFIGRPVFKILNKVNTNVVFGYPAFENKAQGQQVYAVAPAYEERIDLNISGSTIKILLESGEEDDEEPEVSTFIPTNEEVLEIVSEIKGFNPLAMLNISILEGESSKPADTNVFKYFNITSSVDTTAEMIFKLGKSGITDIHKVSLYVLEDNWVKLQTEYTVETNDSYFFKAQIPHFSTFMIAEDIYVAPVDTTTSSSSGGSSRRSSTNKYVPPNVTISTDDDVVEDTSIIVLPPNEDDEPKEFNVKLFIILTCVFAVVVFLVLIFWWIKHQDDEGVEDNETNNTN